MPSEANADRSNGTCYFGKHNQTKGDLIPCGNVAFGNWPCCYSGDSCLGFQTANACFDPSTGNTYIAGCTDQNYVDKTCPQKLDFGDQEWVGLLHCGTESNGDTDWGGCKVPSEDSTKLARLPNESCDPYCSTTLWVGTSDIQTFAIVPTSAGGSITWTSGFNPTSTSRPPGTVATSTATSATHEPQISGKGLSTGAKAGIGVGSAVAALLIIGALFWCVRRHRRARESGEKQQAQGHGQAQGPWSPAATYFHPGSAVSPAHSPTTMTTTIVGGGDQPWASSPSPKPYWVLGNDGHAFTGFKNELPANEIQPPPPSSPPVGMMAPPSPTYNIERADSTASGVMADGPAQDSMGRLYVSPQTTGRSGPHSSQVGTDISREHSVPEMQG